MHRSRLEIDEHGADGHGALWLRLARIGMPADRKWCAEVVGGGRAHAGEGQSAAMRLQQVPHAIDAVERVGRNIFQQPFTVARGKEMTGMRDGAVLGMKEAELVAALH